MRRPLSMAAERSEVGYVTTLLTFGADAMLGSYSDQTPLHYAASAKEPECIQRLLQAGAEVDSLTNWVRTPLHLVAAYTKDARHATLLLDAGANPTFAIVMESLPSAGLLYRIIQESHRCF